MKYIAETLFSHLKRVTDATLTCHGDIRELRIFLGSFRPDVIREVGEKFSDYVSGLRPSLQLEFKVGYSLWQEWQNRFLSTLRYDLDLIQQRNWFDHEDRLTHYRDMKWTPGSQSEALIVVLIGVEKATDCGSLKDFYRVDSSVLWERDLNRSFDLWINRMLADAQIDREDDHVREMDEVLKLLRESGPGNLEAVSDFLERLDLRGADISRDVVQAFYEQLTCWDLPIIRPDPMRRNGPKMVREAGEFFSFQALLKDKGRKNALKKIDEFEKNLSEGNIGPFDQQDFGEAFQDTEDFLTCLRSYITNNDSDSRSKLLQCNFVFIQERILQAKSKKSVKKEKPDTVTKISGSPLESFLGAIWTTAIDYKQQCVMSRCNPFRSLQEILLEGEKFAYDTGDKASAEELLLGCLGGIDSYLENYLRLEGDGDDDHKSIRVTSKLLDQEVISYGPAGSSVPSFSFKVTFRGEDSLQQERHFRWLLPATHPFRTLWNLARITLGKMGSNVGNVLPVFHVQYYDELFLAPDEEELNRILTLGMNDFEVFDLWDAPRVDKQDPLRALVRSISGKYAKFLSTLVSTGYFTALGDPLRDLIDAASDTYKELVTHNGLSRPSQLAPLFYKAFLFIGKPNEPSREYLWNRYVESAVVTGLHPALLEMLNHREVFLMHGFVTKMMDALTDVSGLKMKEGDWTETGDMAEIHYPLFGLITNRNNDLDTRLNSFGLIHRIGKPRRQATALTSKILARYEVPDDDDIADSELFRPTRESQVVTRVLEDYCELHVHARDGMQICVLNVQRVQPIIAAIDGFLKTRPFVGSDAEVLEQGPPYHFSLALYLRPETNEDVGRWIAEWKKRWGGDRVDPKFSYYNRCRISCSQRIVAEMEGGTHGPFAPDDPDLDIAFLTHFIHVDGTSADTEETEPFKRDLKNPLKFPVIEIPRCVYRDPAFAFERSRIISNRQFDLARWHSQISAQFKHPVGPSGQPREHIVISKGDYQPWRKVVDELHKKATWVVCIDPSIDEYLVAEAEGDGGQRREIIGFASGLGVHGELNYTISTAKASLSQLTDGVREQLKGLFSQLPANRLQAAADFLVQESRGLSGLSLVRAIGPTNYVHDLISYTVANVCRPKIEPFGTPLCDELVSLDDFRHWFNSATESERPDLLRLTAFLTPQGMLRVNAQVIECKLGLYSAAYVEKAKIQLMNGLKRLTTLFRPKKTEGTARFDQRFWWGQLQRLIATRSRVSEDRLYEVTAGLELVTDGDFEICWQAFGIGLWRDRREEDLIEEASWVMNVDEGNLEVKFISCGTDFIRKVCCDLVPVQLPSPSSSMCYGRSSAEIAPASESGSNESFAVRYEADQENAAETDTRLEFLVTQKKHRKLESDRSNTVKPGTRLEFLPAAKEHIREQPEGYGQRGRIPKDVPKRILLGASQAGRQVYWEFGHSELTNRHLLIFGKSGSGKTYAIQAILCELAAAGQNSLIVDYTNGFEDSRLEPETNRIVKLKQHVVQTNPLPIDPFRRQTSILGDRILEEKTIATAGRVMSIFASVYDLGDQQKSVLYQVIKAGIEKYGEAMDLERLRSLLEERSQEGTAKDSAASLLSKLVPFVDAQPFGAGLPDAWSNIYHDEEFRVHVIQLANCPREMSRLVTEFALFDLYAYARGSGVEKDPKVVVLDEIQNLDHSEDGPLAGFLREGRKFGLSMILATQTLRTLSNDAQDRLFQASHKLFFRPAETEVQEYAKLMERTVGESHQQWITKLSGLGKGECWSWGPSLDNLTGRLAEKPFKIKITSLADRMEKLFTGV